MSNRLAELMREGIKITKPLRDYWIKRTPSRCYACAMGAAIFACNAQAPQKDEHGYVEMLQECSGINMRQIVMNPVSGARNPLWLVIEDLNDGERWPRLKIAKWVDSLDLN